MEKVPGEIRLNTTDSELNQLLQRKSDSAVGYHRHFSQGEDFFLRLGREYTVPSFAIHHDVSSLTPDPAYLKSLRQFMAELQPMLPGVFEGLTYVFDPAEVLRPGFFQLYRVSGVCYLYLLKLDLLYRPQNHVVVEKGSNDTTPVYRTANLVVEAAVVPLKDVDSCNDRSADDGSGDGPHSFLVDQLISDTWIGETGRGYFVQGIWIDTDLNKFFTKLVIPEGKRIYPYYPFSSKFRTICYHPVRLEADARREAIPFLHQVREFLTPHLDEIQAVLRETEFSPDIPLFQHLRAKVPPEWPRYFDTFSLDVYLNDQDMREFEIVETTE